MPPYERTRRIRRGPDGRFACDPFPPRVTDSNADLVELKKHNRFAPCATCETDTRQALETRYFDVHYTVPFTWTCIVCLASIDDDNPTATVVRLNGIT